MIHLSQLYKFLFVGMMIVMLFPSNLIGTGPRGEPEQINILPVEKQAALMNEILLWRLENIIPMVMRREGIDMWLLINRENNEDPLYLTMVPQPNMTARRRFLMFFDRRENQKIERLDGTSSGTGDFYQGMKIHKEKNRFENMIAAIRERNPRKIGINTSANWAHADGLSASLKQKLMDALGPDFSSRLVSAERLCVGWLETRSPLEMKNYIDICGVAHRIIKEFFSSRVVTPGVTTTEEVRWWIRQRVNDLGLSVWFQPDIFLTRKQSNPPQINHKSSFEEYYIDPENPRGVTIQRGDLLHCDFGIIYMGLCTDMQWEAYVCRSDETQAPPGILAAHQKALRMAEIYMKEFKTGRTGTEIAFSAIQKGKQAGISAYIYSHPVGYHGHGAGVNLYGRTSWKTMPEPRSNRSRYPLRLNTSYAIEFQIITEIPEWGGQLIRWGFEEDAVFTQSGCRFIDGYEKELILIR